MYRTLVFLLASLLAIGSVVAQESKKLTGAELKEMTRNGIYYAGYDSTVGVWFLVSLFPNGSRDLYWTNGVQNNVRTGQWRIHGDQYCFKDGDRPESCSEWRKSGDRYEFWRENKRAGYFQVLPAVSRQ